MDNLFICYSKCSSCKKAKKWLDDNEIPYIEREIKEDIPKFKELKIWIEKSNFPIKSFFNTSGMKYRELGLKDRLETMPDDEKIELLSTEGMLIKRPILVTEDDIFIAFKEKEWAKKLI